MPVRTGMSLLGGEAVLTGNFIVLEPLDGTCFIEIVKFGSMPYFPFHGVCATLSL